MKYINLIGCAAGLFAGLYHYQGTDLQVIGLILGIINGLMFIKPEEKGS